MGIFQCDEHTTSFYQLPPEQWVGTQLWTTCSSSSEPDQEGNHWDDDADNLDHPRHDLNPSLITPIGRLPRKLRPASPLWTMIVIITTIVIIILRPAVSILHLAGPSRFRKNSIFKKNLDLTSLVWLQIPKAINTSNNHSFLPLTTTYFNFKNVGFHENGTFLF